MELKHGIALDYDDTSMLLECVDYRINQMKSEIKARDLNPQSFKGAFRKLFAMKGRLVLARNGIVAPHEITGEAIEGDKSE